MRVSLTLDMRNPDRREWADHWDDCLWFLEQAEPLGLDSVFVQEHFFTEDGYAPSVPVFLTELIRRTKSIRVGAWAYVLPLHHPGHLAQEIAVLDHLSRGRLDIVLAAGHSPDEYRAFGIDIRSRPSRMQEGVDVLLGAWEQDRFDFNGKYYTFEDLTVQPKPLQVPHPRLWMASTAVPSAIRAARNGMHLAAATVDPTVFDAYREAYSASGRDLGDARISIPMSITTTYEDPDRVWRRNFDRYQERYSYYERIRTDMGDEQLQLGTPEVDSEKYRENELIGTPDAVFEGIRQVVEMTGATDLVLTGPAAGIDLRGEATDSMALFSEEVLPRLRDL